MEGECEAEDSGGQEEVGGWDSTNAIGRHPAGEILQSSHYRNPFSYSQMDAVMQYISKAAITFLTTIKVI